MLRDQPSANEGLKVESFLARLHANVLLAAAASELN